MIDLILIGGAVLFALWATVPPRGEQRRWLVTAWGVLWVALLLVGWQRGIQPGYAPWLAMLAAIGALIGLLLFWSASNLLSRPREQEGRDAER